MKKFVLLLLFIGAILFAGCKKDIIPPPTGGGGSTTKVYTLNVDTTGLNGSAIVNPLSYKVNEGASVTPTIELAPGYHISTASLSSNKAGGVVISGNEVTINDVASSATLKLKVTDSLTKAGIDTLVKNLSGVAFRDTAAFNRPSSGVDTNWYPASLSTRDQNAHFVHTVTSTTGGIVSGNYQEIDNSTNSAFVTGTFSISANGKYLAFKNAANNQISNIEIVSLSSTQFVYIVFDYSVHTDYKFVAERYKK
jgi:hypothetical protein